jgi:hypothetical protein
MSQFKNVASCATIKPEKAVKVRLSSFVDNKAPAEAILSEPVNLNELSVDERLRFLRGPKISVVMEGWVIFYGVVPLPTFMATSERPIRTSTRSRSISGLNPHRLRSPGVRCRSVNVGAFLK